MPVSKSPAEITIRISKRAVVSIGVVVVLALSFEGWDLYKKYTQLVSETQPAVEQHPLPAPQPVANPAPAVSKTEEHPANPSLRHQAAALALTEQQTPALAYAPVAEKAPAVNGQAVSQRPSLRFVRLPAPPTQTGEEPSPETSSVTVIADAPDIKLGPASLNGAGATQPHPLYAKWFAEFHKAHPEITINYQAIGSGGGFRQLEAGTTDFGATDGFISDEQLARSPLKIIQIPTVVGAVVFTYNLPGIAGELRLTPDIVVGIFSGAIKQWNDPRMIAINSGLQLPDRAIVPVHHSEAAASTYMVTEYFSRESAEWRNTVHSGLSVSWPVGLGAKGNEGVAAMVRQMEGSIGYVDFTYAQANKLAAASLRNSAGEFVPATLETVEAAAATVKNPPQDFRVALIDSPGKDAYPIASFTWLLTPVEWSDANKRKAFISFVNWMINDGEAMSSQLGFAPLPQEIGASVKQKVRGLQ